jgi:hypothetical protein
LKSRAETADTPVMRRLPLLLAAFVSLVPGAGRALECKTNLVFLADTSGSMANVRWHPAFDPTAVQSCNWHTSTLSVLHDTTEAHCGTTRTYRVDPVLEARGIPTRFDPR